MNKADALTQAGKAAVLQNVQGTLQFLQRFPPFSQMAPEHLNLLVEQCHLRFFAGGESILTPGDGPAEHFHIVKQGRVVGKRPQSARGGTGTGTVTETETETGTTFEITTGECFPMAALLGERATRTEHVAGEDTFCFQLPKAAFIRLFALSDVFRDFALRGVSQLLEHANQHVRRQAVETLGTQYSVNARLGDLALRHPVTCPPSMPIRDAVKAMHEHQVGSIVVVDEAGAPIGIFTLRDLREVIASGNTELAAAIASRMSPAPFALTPEASAFDAAIAMTERYIAHVCLVKQGRLCGVVSERDLFSLQRVDLVHLARTLRRAPRLEALANLRGEIGQMVERMLAFGASAAQITRIITQLNDHTTCRVIELCLEQWGDPGIPFTWLAFGSEARQEQTLHTDQDNGMLFEAEDALQTEQYRAQLLPLAHQINLALAQCGFALCQGQVMAGNPQLCLSRAEWGRRFSTLVREASPQSLLESSIYFDLRSIWGDEQPCQWLRQHLLGQVAASALFQRFMADNALRQRPPVGRLREFVLARQGRDKPATLDLKTQGLGPFVDGARVLALAHGVEASNTVERLRQLVLREVLDPLDGAAFEEAYLFIQQTRMQQHQQQARNNLPWSNRLAPDTLNQLDRRILRESLRQAQRLQASLALRYQL